MVEVAASRAAQEVQAAMIVAKKFPRDPNTAWTAIQRACHRPTLARVAMYAYPRGSTTVEGPSIRMAEALAQNWGNMDFGIVEIEQRRGESTMMAYAWDLETNTRQTRIFTVRHERHTRRGTTHLTDPRDVYEMTANQGARRVRACILGIIPGDIVEAAIDECNRTLAGQSKLPLVDRIRKMVAAFSEMGVTQDMIRTRVGKNLDALTETELVGLGKIWNSINDGMSKPGEWFGAPATAAGADGLADRLTGQGDGDGPPVEGDDPATKAKAAEQVEALRNADAQAGPTDGDGTKQADPKDPGARLLA